MIFVHFVDTQTASSFDVATAIPTQLRQFISYIVLPSRIFVCWLDPNYRFTRDDYRSIYNPTSAVDGHGPSDLVSGQTLAQFVIADICFIEKF